MYIEAEAGIFGTSRGEVMSIRSVGTSTVVVLSSQMTQIARLMTPAESKQLTGGAPKLPPHLIIMNK